MKTIRALGITLLFCLVVAFVLVGLADQLPHSFAQSWSQPTPTPTPTQTFCGGAKCVAWPTVPPYLQTPK